MRSTGAVGLSAAGAGDGFFSAVGVFAAAGVFAAVGGGAFVAAGFGEDVLTAVSAAGGWGTAPAFPAFFCVSASFFAASACRFLMSAIVSLISPDFGRSYKALFASASASP